MSANTGDNQTLLGVKEVDEHGVSTVVLEGTQMQVCANYNVLKCVGTNSYSHYFYFKCFHDRVFRIDRSQYKIVKMCYPKISNATQRKFRKAT